MVFQKSLFFLPHFLIENLQPKQQRLFISCEAAGGIKMPFLKPQNKPGSCPAVSKVLLINGGQIRRLYPFVNKLWDTKGIVTFLKYPVIYI